MKNALIGCLGVAVTILLIGFVVIWFWVIRELPMLDATLTLPNETALESTVDMVVTVTNPHEEAVTLDSIDIDDSFLAGFQVINVDPEPKSTMHIPILNQRTWNFGMVVQPEEAHSVTFRLRSMAEGHFSGYVDVCNPNQDFKSLSAYIEVKETLSNQALDPTSE